MTKEQLNWTDEQWAAHFQCTVPQVIAAREWLQSHYDATVYLDISTKRYGVSVSRFQDTPSGVRRIIPVVTSCRQFATPRAAASYANNKFLPNIELTPMRASMFNKPAKILQMLHVAKVK